MISLDEPENGVQFISVNNAVLICKDCVEEHRKLPSGISYVISLIDAGERYSPHKVELLKFGGNDRFKCFLDTYRDDNDESIFKGMPIGQKYSTNACKYYRHKIQSLAKAETPQMDPPLLEEATAIIDDDIEGNI